MSESIQDQPQENPQHPKSPEPEETESTADQNHNQLQQQQLQSLSDSDRRMSFVIANQTVTPDDQQEEVHQVDLTQEESEKKDAMEQTPTEQNGVINHGFLAPETCVTMLRDPVHFQQLQLDILIKDAEKKRKSSKPNQSFRSILKKFKSFTTQWFKWILFVLYNVYLLFGIMRTWHKVSDTS